MTELETLGTEYFHLLEQQRFVESKLDYSVFDKHKPFLEQLAQVGNTGVTVFDLSKKQHIYTSYNFSELFGYDLKAVAKLGNSYFDERVHPEDIIELLRNGIAIIKFYYSRPKAERANYKFVNEYRIIGGEKKYINVIEQHQTLELDHNGNIWLSLGIIDISPNQTEFQGVKSQLFNYKTGKVISSDIEKKETPHLSKREKEVLQLVKEGLLSKEISEKLFISTHAVNTHRHKILKKLNANNSVEAISYASKFGLVK